MVAESGARLLDEDAQAALVELVVARATVVTPNLPEARVLAGDAALEGEALARAVHALGPRRGGGHRRAPRAGDRRRLRRGARRTSSPGPRYPDGAAHGSGCTHSSTLAARLALGDDLQTAAREAKRVAVGGCPRRPARRSARAPGPVDVARAPPAALSRPARR